MNRTGLIIALAVAAVVGLVFGLYPQLDVVIARAFFSPTASSYAIRETLLPLRNATMWLVAVVAAPAFIALVLKLVLPQRRILLPSRAVVLMIVTLALGPGLVANVILKDYYGRPRPAESQVFGRDQPFVAWWNPHGVCLHNCSFVSGDVSAGFWTLAPAAVVPAPWRPLAYTAAVAFGTGIAVMRMLFGAHFFTDTVFAGVITFLIIWMVYNYLYCWPATRLTDAAIERWLERLVRPRSWFRRADGVPPASNERG